MSPGPQWGQVRPTLIIDYFTSKFVLYLCTRAVCIAQKKNVVPTKKKSVLFLLGLIA